MVIRGNIWGNGPQLAAYLSTEGGNARIHILEVDGRLNASEGYLQQALHTMSLTAELTRTDKGLYHAQINPAYREDSAMSADDWQRAADILGHELGLDEQRRVIVLHTKKDRTHLPTIGTRSKRKDRQTGDRVFANRHELIAEDKTVNNWQKQLQIAEIFLQAAPEITDTQIENDLPIQEKNTVSSKTDSTQADDTEPSEAHEGQGDKEKSRERLKDFMLSGNELTTKPDLAPDKQRQRSVARQFFDNDDMFAKPPSNNQSPVKTGDQHPQTSTDPELTATSSADNADADHDALLQKLVQEQKALRERKRQGHKKRIR